MHRMLLGRRSLRWCRPPLERPRHYPRLCVDRTPLQELQDYKRQMGWRFPWVPSLGSDFNYDFGVAFTEEQRKNGADYNFRHVDEPEPQQGG